MTRIGVILGSTRQGRNGELVADWVTGIAAARHDAEFELVDLRNHPLPHLGEVNRRGADETEALVSSWGRTISSFDGFVIVTPEYNHSIPGVLKNAIDHLQAEWHNKAVGIVSYGGLGGARAAEHLRLIAGELQMADVRQQVALSLMTEFSFGPEGAQLRPGPYNTAALNTLLDQVVSWSEALAHLRAPGVRPDAA